VKAKVQVMGMMKRRKGGGGKGHTEEDWHVDSSWRSYGGQIWKTKKDDQNGERSYKPKELARLTEDDGRRSVFRH